MERMDAEMTKWTKEPPKEAGYYWVIDQWGDKSVQWCFKHGREDRSGNVCYATAVSLGHLWWPIPIEPPKEDQ